VIMTVSIRSGRVGSHFFTCSGLVQSANELGWIGSHKMDPWTTRLHCHVVIIGIFTARSTCIARYYSCVVRVTFLNCR